MTLIVDIFARQIFDSRGNPTVEVDVLLESGALGRAAVPSGASTGKYEALEKRDGDQAHFKGKGVFQAISAINGEICENICGLEAFDQRELDQTLIDLDGTQDKSRLGANALLGVSLAAAHAAALELEVPLYRHIGGVNSARLPMPMMNIINGGAHADNAVDFQEFMVVPTGAKTFTQAMEMGVSVFHELKSLLQKKGFSTNVGDEGGFAPNLSSSKETLDFILQASEKAGYSPGKDIAIALDVAASTFFKDGAYDLKGEERILTSDQLGDYYKELCQAYPIVSIEDGFEEDDFNGWMRHTQMLGESCQLVGDDLFVTNPDRLSLGFEKKMANAILIKLNQIGTLTETLDVMEMAQRKGYACVVSHRSGETEDTTIADLAVATGSGQIKTGSLSRTDRMCKYNRLLRIEEELGTSAFFENPF